MARFGFSRVAYRGLETGSRHVVTHVVRQGRITFAFSSQLTPGPCAELGDDIGAHLVAHGDGVKDVAFAVSDARAIYASAVARGATPVVPPREDTDADGTVVIATVKTYGNTLHSFVQRGAYAGAFLPGFRAVTAADPLERITPPIGLEFVDHVVGNMPDKGMLPTVEWYERVLQVGARREGRGGWVGGGEVSADACAALRRSGRVAGGATPHHASLPALRSSTASGRSTTPRSTPSSRRCGRSSWRTTLSRSRCPSTSPPRASGRVRRAGCGRAPGGMWTT